MTANKSSEPPWYVWVAIVLACAAIAFGCFYLFVRFDLDGIDAERENEPVEREINSRWDMNAPP